MKIAQPQFKVYYFSVFITQDWLKPVQYLMNEEVMCGAWIGGVPHWDLIACVETIRRWKCTNNNFKGLTLSM